MNILQLSICTLVFGSTLLLGTTAVIASRFLITTVASFTKPAAVRESVVVPVHELERVVDLPDLRNMTPVQEDLDPTGVYALDIRKLPIAFADIELVQIATREYEEKEGTYSNHPIVPMGTLEIINRSFSLTKISIGNREISFETNTKDGISYQFIGNFVVPSESINCEGCEPLPDLKGKLKKLKNGKVIAELDAQFYVVACRLRLCE